MDDNIKDIWKLQSAKKMADEDVIASRGKKSNDLLEVFIRKMNNLTIYFIFIIPLVCMILFLQSISLQAGLIAFIAILISLYITFTTKWWLRKTKPTDKTSSLIQNIQYSERVLIKWRKISLYSIVFPAVIILNLLIILANALSSASKPFNSFDYTIAIPVSVVFGFMLYFWMKRRINEYLSLIKHIQNDSLKSNIRKWYMKFEYAIILLIGFILLIILILTVIK